MKRLVLVLLLLGAPAFANSSNSFPITGSASAGDDEEIFNITGSTFSAYSAAPTFAIFVGFCDRLCTALSGVSAFCCIPGFTAGSLNGVTATTVGGSLQFSFTPFPESAFQNGGFSEPVTFVGQLQGFNANGATLWAVKLKGTGTAGYSLFQSGPNIIGASWTFSGTATVVPEPSTFLLIGTGLSLLAARIRRPSRPPR